MDYLRRSVSLRAYGQRDPLIEYRREGLIRFRQLEEGIRKMVIESIPRIQPTDDARIRAEEEKVHAALVIAGKEGDSGAVQTPLVKAHEYGRNDFVTLKKDNAIQTLKFKKAEPLLTEGWEIVNES